MYRSGERGSPTEWASVLSLGPVALGLLLHSLEALVVVGELFHVRERDLAGGDRVVVGDVRLRVVGAVLELDVHAGAELLEVEAAPVDADRVADAPGLLARGSPGLSHVNPPRRVVDQPPRKSGSLSSGRGSGSRCGSALRSVCPLPSRSAMADWLMVRAAPFRRISSSTAPVGRPIRLLILVRPRLGLARLRCRAAGWVRELSRASALRRDPGAPVPDRQRLDHRRLLRGVAVLRAPTPPVVGVPCVVLRVHGQPQL